MDGRDRSSGFSFSVDEHAVGNQTKVEMPGETRYYEYDAPGRLTEVTVPAGVVTMTYNADGQRVGKASYDGTVEGFVYDGANLLERTDGAGGLDAAYTSTIDEPFGDLLSEYAGATGERHHLYDGSWSTEALVDQAAGVTGPFTHTAFGLPASALTAGWAWLSIDQYAGLGVDPWSSSVDATSGSPFGGNSKGSGVVDKTPDPLDFSRLHERAQAVRPACSLVSRFGKRILVCIRLILARGCAPRFRV